MFTQEEYKVNNFIQDNKLTVIIINNNNNNNTTLPKNHNTNTKTVSRKVTLTRLYLLMRQLPAANNVSRRRHCWVPSAGNY
jgi:hypothetical protein